MRDSEDEGEYQFYGTPIGEDRQARDGYRKDPSKDPAATRQMPLWKQEPTDAQGRRRFHGAFTGGFSAGYFNSVGSAEGWEPSGFVSSRSDRAAAAPQTAEHFMDEDELEDLQRTKLQATAAYDTFGASAAEAARRAAAEEARRRPSAIPGLLPDEAVAPVAEGMGMKLLQRMGWRQGKGIGAGEGSRRGVGRGWGQIAGVGPENTPLHLLKPKTDTHGLGYDPFRGAEEFRAAKEQRSGAAGRGKPRRRGVAFGTGVLDEDDSFGILEDYVTHDDVESYEEAAGMSAEGMPLGRGPRVDRAGLGDRLALQGYEFEVQDEEDSGDEGRAAKRQRPLALPGPAAPLALQSAQHARRRSLIPGFVAAEGYGIQKPAFYPPPPIPLDYVPVHRPAAAKPAPGAAAAAIPLPPAPLEPVPPLSDPNLRQEIERLAFFVAKSGPAMEAIAREEQRRRGGAPGFLLGGEGAGFYSWKLATLRRLLAPRGRDGAAAPPALRPIGQRSAPLTADDRGAMLGEQPLPAAPGSQPSLAAAPEQPAAPPVPLARSLLRVAEEDRKKLAVALGTNFVRAGTQEMSEPSAGGLQPGLRPGAPPRPPPGEAAAAEAGSAPSKPPPRGIVTIQDLSRPFEGASDSAAASAAVAAAAQTPELPVRRTEEWRPEPLLCKRLDVPDPFHGRPKEVQMSRFRTDHLALPATAEAMGRAAAAAAPNAPEFLIPAAVRVAAEEAAAAAQLAAEAAEVKAAPPPPLPPPEEPPPEVGGADDASGAAEAFLKSMFGAPEAEQGMEEGTAAAAAAAAETEILKEVAAIEKPVDLFKAIFEGTSDEEEEEEGGQETREIASEAAEQPAAPASAPAPAPDKTLGFEKFRAAAPPETGPAGLEALDPGVRSRVEAALRVLKESKRRDKKRKKERKSSKKKSKKRWTSRKEERKDRKERRHKRARRGSGASSASESRSSSSSGTDSDASGSP